MQFTASAVHRPHYKRTYLRPCALNFVCHKQRSPFVYECASWCLRAPVAASSALRTSCMPCSSSYRSKLQVLRPANSKRPAGTYTLRARGRQNWTHGDYRRPLNLYLFQISWKSEPVQVPTNSWLHPYLPRRSPHVLPAGPPRDNKPCTSAMLACPPRRFGTYVRSNCHPSPSLT